MITLPLPVGSLAGLTPMVFGILAVALRLTEHWLVSGVPPGHDLSRTGRLLVEALSVAAQVSIVAAGVALAMLWGAR